MKSNSNTLAGFLRAARAEALARNNSVTISTPVFGDYAQPLQMYMDVTGGNDAYEEGDGDVLIREFDFSSNNVSIKGNAAAAGGFISYSGDGRLDEGGNTAIIEICQGSDGAYDTTTGQTITINIVGRVSITEGVTDCTP